MTGCTLGSCASFDGSDLVSGKMSSDLYEIFSSCQIHIKSNFNRVWSFLSEALQTNCQQICLNTWSNVSLLLTCKLSHAQLYKLALNDEGI